MTAEPQQMVGRAHFGRRMIAALTGGDVTGERLRFETAPPPDMLRLQSLLADL